MSRYNYIFFDLDGTLTESGEGIINSVIYALSKKGIQETDREKLMKFVGPPLPESFMKYYGMTQEEALKYVYVYREYFCEKGWKENRVYDGIKEMLAVLKEEGRHLVLATAKPLEQAIRIMDYFGLSPYFEVMDGATLDEKRNRKWEVINHAIEQIGREHQAEILMVGDRENDVSGARKNDLPCIGVLYGYGSRSELEEAGAAKICEHVKDIPAAIRDLENN